MADNSTSQAKQRVSGVILIDKPKGMTSQQVVAKVKYLFKSPLHDSKKAGHTGTLDPMATGLLPICLGEATKFSHYQLDADKSYEAVIQLGSQTDTGDAEGQVIAQSDVVALTTAKLKHIESQFLGQQTQIPPMYSALKKEGKKLYEYARAGIEVERQPRPIFIKNLSCEVLTASSVSIKVTCSKGTYVRVLGEDIAKALGTLGHLTALRRVQVGDFKVEGAISLDTLEALTFEHRFERLLCVDACIADIPKLILDDTFCARLKLGQRINVNTLLTDELKQYLLQDTAIESMSSIQPCDTEQVAKDIRILNTQNQFTGLATLQLSGRLQPKKMINI